MGESPLEINDQVTRDPKISFFLIFFYMFLLIFVWKLQKIHVSAFMRNLGCTPYARNWVFFPNLGNSTLLLLYYSACKKAIAIVFI